MGTEQQSQNNGYVGTSQRRVFRFGKCLAIAPDSPWRRAVLRPRSGDKEQYAEHVANLKDLSWPSYPIVARPRRWRAVVIKNHLE